MSTTSSSSSRAPELKYDVFLNFSEETRDNFISFLHDALSRQQINTIIDNELARGDEASQALLNAIRESKIAVMVFSKHYASSKSCLDQLVQILDCKRNYKQIVIPVFYRIGQSDVEKQLGTFEDAFVKHEAKYKKKLHVVHRWRESLTEAGGLTGWSSFLIRREATLIQEIVNDIMKRLNISPVDSNMARFDAEPITMKPWGGHGGSHWIFKENGVITEIVISHSQVVNSIVFKSSNGVNSNKFGGDGGTTEKIVLNSPKEYLTGISGTTRSDFCYVQMSNGETKYMEIISSICFYTNRNTYGPFGIPTTGNAFKFECEGRTIVGFHGRSGLFLDAIGVYLMPSIIG